MAGGKGAIWVRPTQWWRVRKGMEWHQWAVQDEGRDAQADLAGTMT